MQSETRPVKFLASTLETIDTGMYEWIDGTLNLHTKTNKGIYKELDEHTLCDPSNFPKKFKN